MSPVCRWNHCLGLGQSPAPNGCIMDPASGRYQLAEAVNVDVIEGRLRRRPGFSRLLDQGFHSLFSDGGNLYGGLADTLCLIPAQGDARVLRAGLTAGADLAFVAVGDTVYFANGFETGVIRDGTAGPWSAPAYPGPDRLGRYVPPPAGHRLAHQAGRIWIAREELVLFTEGAGLLDWLDSLAGFLPPACGRIRMLRAVAGGLLIGDEAGVTFAAGHDPATMTFVRVCSTAPIPGSDAPLVPGRHEAVAGCDLDGLSAIWAGRDGIYCGRGNGRVKRLATANFQGAGRASAATTTARYLLTLLP
jgi:hypothetical protein